MGDSAADAGSRPDKSQVRFSRQITLSMLCFSTLIRLSRKRQRVTMTTLGLMVTMMMPLKAKWSKAGRTRAGAAPASRSPHNSTFFNLFFQSNLIFNRRVAKFNATKTLRLPIASCKANFARTSKMARSNRWKS